MADAPGTPSGTGSKSSFGFLGRKVGPFPVIIWGGMAVGGYLLWKRFGGGGQPAAASPTIIEARGPRGPAGPPGKPGPVRPPRRRKHPPRWRPPRQRFRGAEAAVPEPVPAAAPMTATGIYGDVPVATPQGTFYDSGQPLEGEYVPAG